MTSGFSGEVATYYARHRRGYAPTVLDALTATFPLGADDTAIDLGCGTGQLSIPLAARIGAVVGMDPEPDMLALARCAGVDAGTTNVTWILGGDGDHPPCPGCLAPGRSAR
ncbi:class I SAM-dependent methyltransferase [Micromonospora sp. NPDC050980]|uniref:class I SAM-dependent methyltransferase n=1 Tax=Micromonospora sp. NPDC050980 TaxID=3155161 RepID=UPI0033E11686